MPTDLDTAMHLRRRLANAIPELEKWDAYYSGTQPLSYMAPELLIEMEGRIRQVVINWPQLVVDAVEERLDVEGFRLDDEVDDRLWGWWQANDLDEESGMAHVDALALSRAYAIVGAPGPDDDPGVPIITVESPMQVYARRDPRTRRVTSAIKTWGDHDERHMVLYTPTSTTPWASDAGGKWLADGGPDVHNLGRVPVVPLVNRQRTLGKAGVSELASIVPLSDAACKIATDMMISAEFNAIPRLIALGLTDKDFVDDEGKPTGKWEQIAGRIWTLENPPGEAEVKQLPVAELRNFHDTINSLARMAGAMAGLPPHYFGWSDSNPASADAIRSSETRLVKKAERRQRAFGGAWENVMRLGMLIIDGELPAEAARMETVWRDPSTPTVAQAADALGKFAALLDVPKRALWPKIPGVTQTEVKRWEEIAEEDRKASASATATAFGINGPTGTTSDMSEPDSEVDDPEPAAV